jgi:two-component system cell cycle sensor histidine kinase/response regulator CckA
MVEDSEPDAELLLAELARIGYDVTFERVQTAEAMTAALDRGPWDLVLSDYSLPAFSAPAALALLHEAACDVPFLIISGTIGEETAVAALKAGAHDFVIKGRLARLAPAIDRALRDVATRLDHVRLQAQLHQAQKMEAIGQLAGGIAHDFNNLLTAILGYTELLTDQIGPDKPMGRDLREIMAAGQRAAALTRQLLAFSRKQVLELAPLDLNEIVHNVGTMLRRLLGEHIAIETALADRLRAVLADAPQLEQVLVNLAVNARDAMPQGGVLSIATRNVDLDAAYAASHAGATAGSYAMLSVSDTGTGMTREIQAKIFEPFFTTKGCGQGTGLGLAAVYGIVKQLHGYIGVASELGRGTTFQMYLPTTQQSARAAAPHAAPRPQVGTETVLLVEDEPGVREFIRLALRRFGYAVVDAGNAEEALILLAERKGPIHLLLTDVVLPGITGRELAARVTQGHPHVPVLFMSGYTDEMRSTEGVLESGVQLLEKPFTAQALLTKIRQRLDSPGVTSPGMERESADGPTR